MARDAKYGDIDVPGIPDDEPIFIIRAKDRSAPQAIMQYAETSIINGSPSEHAASCRQIAGDFRSWQEENQDVVKPGD